MGNCIKHPGDFLGLKEQANKLGLESFALPTGEGKRQAENYSILTQQKLGLELSQILADETDSELNGEHSFISVYCAFQ